MYDNHPWLSIKRHMLDESLTPLSHAKGGQARMHDVLLRQPLKGCSGTIEKFALK